MDATPARCDVDDGHIHPVYIDSPAGRVPPTGVPTDPYALEDIPSGDGGCEASQPT
ncbi:hypothetical protein [Nonomuraea sp. B5E05]|uniref:hypothetical protein n=1 Tax=Nonomuraea sp. B5E05 TaxID=3153569 RepID=UPI003261B36C